MRTERFWILGGFALLLCLGCRGKETVDTRLDTFPVRVEKAAKRDLVESITLVGTIKARDEATLFSRVPGKLLRNVVREGDRIEKNAPVAFVERDEVGVKFEPAPVPSTLTGLVARVYLDRGANVTLSTPIALVVDASRVLVQAEIPERYAGRVTVKQIVEVHVDAYPDRTFHGGVSRLSPVVNAATRSTYMEAGMDNSSGLLKSGMFAKVAVVTAKRNGALSVPLEALNEPHDAVFIVEGTNARQRKVRVGLMTDKYAEVSQGLEEGDQVVTFGLYGLKEGSPVEILK
ncbi:MAG: efflux RND transporter periplasmic adaptor subunit [Pseudomonadota bacterium]